MDYLVPNGVVQMKKLIFRKPERKSDYHQCYTKDIQRIVSVCEQKGYQISEQDAIIAWEKYSEDYYAAGWMMLPKDDKDVFGGIMRVMEEEK